MASYRTVSVSFWNDPKVEDDFTPEDKYFYLYLLTNPHTNIAGCYEIGCKAMERETGYNSDTLNRLINRMEYNHGVIKYNQPTKEILILHWNKYNWSASEKVVKAVREVAKHIKYDKFREYVETLADGKEPEYREQSTDTEYRVQSTDISIGYTYPMNTVSEAPKKPVKRFVKPSLEEVTAYVREHGYNVDPERFMDYYEANGWKVGKNAMKDWKATVRNWNKNGYNTSTSTRSKKEGFTDYEGRDIDYTALERKLLGY